MGGWGEGSGYCLSQSVCPSTLPPLIRQNIRRYVTRGKIKMTQKDQHDLGQSAARKEQKQATDTLSTFFFFHLFYFWLRWVFVAVRGLSLGAASEGYSSLRCAGFPLQWLLLLRSTDSRRAGFGSCGSWAPEHRLSSCGARA